MSVYLFVNLFCYLNLFAILVNNFAGYHAPMDTFMELNKLTVEGDISTEQNINICIGKEWYRYPSSFFLPSEK